jgi:GntR family transcriptional repressor for pyruvate dehydrogenase complex
MIKNGAIKVGERLPGQRSLANQLGIGRSSLREAIRHLEVLGILKTKPGLGTYVISDKPKSFETPLETWLAEHRDEVNKVFEVREAVESKAAELASTRATQEEIHDISKVLEKMGEAIEQGEIEKATELDLAFHDLISNAADNELLCQIIDSIQESLKKSRQAVLALPGRAKRSLAEHKKILEAIKEAKPNVAKQAMVEHLREALSDIPDDEPERTSYLK